MSEVTASASEPREPHESASGPLAQASESRVNTLPLAAVPVKAELHADGASPPTPDSKLAVRTTTTVGRASSALTRALPVGVYRLTRVGPAGLAGLGSLAAAVVLALTVLLGAHTASDHLTAQLASMQHHRAAPTPEQELARVVTMLPARERMPAIVGEILQQATAAGVTLSTGHYSYSPPGNGRVARYELEFPVAAEYPKVRDFIDRTLQQVPYATVDKLQVERKVVGDVTVKADVRFVVFVNDGAAL